MAVVPIISQSWDTTSYVNPTRMNNIETNISTLSKATGIEYSSGVSVKDKIDEVTDVNTYEFAYSTPQNYQLSFNYSEYKLVGINTLNSSNHVLNTAILPMSYFKVVNRVILGNFLVAYGGNDLIYASSTGGSADVTKVVVFGILK